MHSPAAGCSQWNLFSVRVLGRQNVQEVFPSLPWSTEMHSGAGTDLGGRGKEKLPLSLSFVSLWF